MKTVFILGAGSSKSFFHLPLMNDFFSSFDASIYQELNNFLDSYFWHFSNDKSKINMEEVTTCLALLDDRVGSFGQISDPKVNSARQEFFKYIFSVLSNPVNRTNIKEVLNLLDLRIDEFANNGNDEINIITFNYDLGLDQLIKEVSRKTPDGDLCRETVLQRMSSILRQARTHDGDRPSVFWDYKNRSMYLKLHGSLDWLYCPNERCFHHQQFFPNYFTNTPAKDKIDDPCGLCGSPLAPVIVPPSLLKSFELFPKLGLLWNLAFKKLNQADKIVVLGLSFSASDYYLRWLLKASTMKRNSPSPIVEVIDISDHPKMILEEITGLEIIFRDDLKDIIKN